MTPMNNHVTFDPEANALYIYFDTIKPGQVHTTYEIGFGINLDVDKEYNALGLEILLPENIHPQVKETLLKQFDIRKQTP